MKTIKLLFVTAILVCSNTIFANNGNLKTKKPTSEPITNEIGKLLKNNYFSVNEETLAKVYFTINKDNEIVVLSVESDSVEVKDFIKSRLNYYKTSVKGTQPGKKYLLPVRFFSK